MCCSDAFLTNAGLAESGSAGAGGAAQLGAEHSDAAHAVIVAQGLSKCYSMAGQRSASRASLLLDALRGETIGAHTSHEKQFWALHNLSFSIARGEAMGILGRNGSGKSTLLQLLAGTLAPTTGSVRVRGRVAALLELGSGFNPEFTGRENVFLNASILGLSRAEVQERFDDIASFADIGSFLDQPVKTYSSGMLVRLAFAVQVQLSPDVLIVDEALAVGDALFQKRCYQRIDELRQKGVTLLFVSHDTEAVRTLTDRAMLLERGQLREIGSSASVLLAYRKVLHEEERAWHASQMQRVEQAAGVTQDGRGALAQTGLERGTSGASEAGASGAGGAGDGAARGSRVAGMAKELSFGDLDASVQSVRVVDAQGEKANVFYPGERVKIVIEVLAHRQIEHPNVIFRLRSKQGLKVTNWGLLNDDIARRGRGEAMRYWPTTLHAGERLRAEFAFDCHLGVNLYEVQAGVTQELDASYRSQRMLHWRDEAAFFTVGQRVDTYNFGGAFDMQCATSVERLPAVAGQEATR
jgi:lipopolysaccharide transport system ATP-binding protein